jgi:hypothetical protein
MSDSKTSQNNKEENKKIDEKDPNKTVISSTPEENKEVKVDENEVTLKEDEMVEKTTKVEDVKLDESSKEDDSKTVENEELSNISSENSTIEDETIEDEKEVLIVKEDSEDSAKKIEAESENSEIKKEEDLKLNVEKVDEVKKDKKDSKKGVIVAIVIGFILLLLTIGLVLTIFIVGKKEEKYIDLKNPISSVKNLLNSPESSMDDFYAAVEKKDYETAKQYVDTNSIANNIIKEVESLGNEIPEEEANQYKEMMKTEIERAIKEGNFMFSKPEIIKVEGDTLEAKVDIIEGGDKIIGFFERRDDKWVFTGYKLDQ